MKLQKPPKYSAMTVSTVSAKLLYLFQITLPEADNDLANWATEANDNFDNDPDADHRAIDYTAACEALDWARFEIEQCLRKLKYKPRRKRALSVKRPTF